MNLNERNLLNMYDAEILKHTKYLLKANHCNSIEEFKYWVGFINGLEQGKEFYTDHIQMVKDYD